MTSATAAAPPHIRLFERNMTGAPVSGIEYVNDVLKRAGRTDRFTDWKPIASPCYGCVAMTESGEVGFVIAANDDSTWLVDGQATRKVAAKDVMVYAWPDDLPLPARELIAGMGSHLNG